MNKETADPHAEIAKAQKPGRRRGGESITSVEIDSTITLKIREKWKEEEHIWPAGEVFARYLALLVRSPTQHFVPERIPVFSRGSLIVEAGSGTGLSGLALAAASSTEDLGMKIICTDGSYEALKNIRKNAALNNLNKVVSTDEWDWRSPILPSWASRVNIIIGSEILSMHSECGKQRGAGPRPFALLLIKVRGSAQPLQYEGSSVEAFIKDLSKRGLVVDILSIPTSLLCATAQEHHVNFRLLHVHAPHEETPSTIDFSSPNFDAAQASGSVGEGRKDPQVDPELLYWASCSDETLS